MTAATSCASDLVDLLDDTLDHVADVRIAARRGELGARDRRGAARR